MIRVASIVLLLVIAVLCSAQEPPSTIKVDVKLVNAFVTVTDERGAPAQTIGRGHAAGVKEPASAGLF